MTEMQADCSAPIVAVGRRFAKRNSDLRLRHSVSGQPNSQPSLIAETGSLAERLLMFFKRPLLRPKRTLAQWRQYPKSGLQLCFFELQFSGWLEDRRFQALKLGETDAILKVEH